MNKMVWGENTRERSYFSSREISFGVLDESTLCALCICHLSAWGIDLHTKWLNVSAYIYIYTYVRRTI